MPCSSPALAANAPTAQSLTFTLSATNTPAAANGTVVSHGIAATAPEREPRTAPASQASGSTISVKRAARAPRWPASMAIASLRTTVEETVQHDGATLDCVRGTLLDSGKEVAMYPGELPTDPREMVSSANGDVSKWLNGDYSVMSFRPARITLKPGDGPPHIRLDQAAEFLIGDKLR